MKKILIAVCALLVTEAGFSQNTFPTTSGAYAGIGTTAPSTALHIVNNSTNLNAANFITIDNRGSNTSYTTTHIVGGLLFSGFRDVRAPANIAGIWAVRSSACGGLCSAGDIVFGTTSVPGNIASDGTLPTESMRINYLGYVGVGTATPAQKMSIAGGSLDVATATGQYTLAQVDNAASSPMGNSDMMGLNAGDLMLRSYWGVSVDLNNGQSGDNPLAQYSRIPGTTSFTINSRSSSTSFANLFTVRNSGNVGIGTTTPLAKLDVRGGNVWINAPNALSNFADNYALNVNGNIRANKLVVNTNGADFVFEPGYKLAPLSKVEEFIKTKHYLPGITPAAQMQKDGVDVGDNQTKLLQKIEELTLYIIELEKKTDKQQGEIEELKKKVN